MAKVVVMHPTYWENFREDRAKLKKKLLQACTLLRAVTQESMGCTPDLSRPDGFKDWDDFDEKVTAFFAESPYQEIPTKQIWYVYETEYPEEGGTVYDATDEQDAIAQHRSSMSEDPNEEPVELSADLLTSEEVDKIMTARDDAQNQLGKLKSHVIKGIELSEQVDRWPDSPEHFSEWFINAEDMITGKKT